MAPDALSYGKGPIHVTVMPALGARISSIRYAGRELLRQSPQSGNTLADQPFSWGSFVMAPWAGRIPAAEMMTETGARKVSPNFRDGSAIHGEVYARGWWQTGPGSFAIESRRQAGQSFDYRMDASLAVDHHGFRYELAITNSGDESIPAGIGWHPWFDADSGRLRIATPARLRYEQDPPGVPLAGGPVANATSHREPSAPRWGTHEILTGLTGPIELVWPEWEIAADMNIHGAFDHLVVFAKRDNDAIAIEPQSHAPDGHRRQLAREHGGIAKLLPGERLSGWVDFRASRETP